MTENQVNPIEEFNARYSKYAEKKGIVAKLGDKTKPGWSDARRALIVDQFTDPRLATAALAEASDSVVDQMGVGQTQDAKDYSLSYFRDNLTDIVKGIEDKGLEAILYNAEIKPVNIENSPISETHNVATNLYATYYGLKQTNMKFDSGAINENTYTDSVLKSASKDIGAIAKVKGSEKAKKIFTGLVVELMLGSKKFTRVAGEVLSDTNFKRLLDYFGTEKANGYNIHEFSRNSLAYTKPEDSMDVVAKYMPR